MTERVDICVVGGGIVGLYCAASLAFKGLSVRLIDKLYIGSSRDNIGDITHDAHPPQLEEFEKLCLKAWEESAHGFAKNIGLMPTGSLQFAFSEEDQQRLQKEVEEFTAAQINAKYIEDMPAVADILSGIRLSEDATAARVVDDDMVIETHHALNCLRQLLIQSGIKIWGSDEVKEFLVDESGAVRGVRTSSNETCMAKLTLVATGIYTEKLLKSLGVKLPMRPARCHLLELKPNGNMPFQMGIQPCEGGYLRYRTKKDGGVLLTYDGILDQGQATYSKEPNANTIAWMRDTIGQIIPALHNAEVKDSRVVTLAVTPDFAPYIGPYEDKAGLLIAAGMCGRSYAYAAGVAQLLTNYILGEELPVDLAPIRADRFAGTQKPKVDFKDILPTYALVNMTEYTAEEEEAGAEEAPDAASPEDVAAQILAEAGVDEAAPEEQTNDDVPLENETVEQDVEAADVEGLAEPETKEVEEIEEKEEEKEEVAEEIKEEKPETPKPREIVTVEKGKKVTAAFGLGSGKK